jgi:hypothetical protein
MDIFQICQIAYSEIEKRWSSRLPPLVFVDEPEGLGYAYETDKTIEINVPRVFQKIQMLRRSEDRLRAIFALLSHEVVGHKYGKTFTFLAPSIKDYLNSLQERDAEIIPTHFQYALLGYKDCVTKLRVHKDFNKMLDILLEALEATRCKINLILSLNMPRVTSKCFC